jgi:hypothetical protein
VAHLPAHGKERTACVLAGASRHESCTGCGTGAARLEWRVTVFLLGRGASFEDVADMLGNSPEIVRKHYAKWSPARQIRIDDLMEKVHIGTQWVITEKRERLQ